MMKKKYWTYDVSTMEIIEGPMECQFRGGLWHLPANSIIDIPLPEKPGFTVLAVAGGGTEYIEDHRGKTVYDKMTGEGRKMTELGPIPETETDIGPKDCESWIGQGWELDPIKVEQKRLLEIENVKTKRQIAYADPITGSDALFNATYRMQKMDEAGWEEKETEAKERFIEIQAQYPWPEEPAT